MLALGMRSLCTEKKHAVRGSCLHHNNILSAECLLFYFVWMMRVTMVMSHAFMAPAISCGGRCGCMTSLKKTVNVIVSASKSATVTSPLPF